MHTLSLFPQVFFLAPLSSFFLRVAAGCIFFYLASHYWEERAHLAQIRFIVIGCGIWIPVLTAAYCVLTGLGLLLGLYTQLAAILAMLFAIKSIVWRNRYREMFPLSKTSATLLLAICISIFITGAGAFAFDLPL